MFTQEMNYFASEKLQLLYSVTFQPYTTKREPFARNSLATMFFFKALQPALMIVKYLGISFKHWRPNRIIHESNK